jgi:hypothetical protein
LPLQLALAPHLFDRHPQIELALLSPFALPKDDEIVAPGRLSRQWCDNWVLPVRFVELPHSKKVAAGRTALAWLCPGNVLSQLRHNPGTPLGGFDLAADVLAHLSIEVDERGVDGLECLLASGGNEADNLGKTCFV